MEPIKDLDLEELSDLELTLVVGGVSLITTFPIDYLKHVDTEEKNPLPVSGTLAEELRPDILPDLSATVEF